MKKKLLFVLTAALLGTSSTFAGDVKPAPRQYIANYENVLGTSLEIKIDALSETNAAKAETAALTEIDRLNKILSGYDTQSEFSKWAATQDKAVKVSKELFEVLQLFEKWRAKTGGALDAAAETVSRLWRDAAKTNQIPSAAAINTAVNVVKMQHYTLNAANQTATHLSNAPLMLNSFTKSYIINKATQAAMHISGVKGIVMNIGGDILVSGNHNEQINVGNPVADFENEAPVASLMLNGKAIATSGNYKRGERITGKWYSHIVDPRNGMPTGHVISATVVAPDAVDAGALATALNVLSVNEGAKLIATIPGAEFMLITADGKHEESAGWKNLEIPTVKQPEIATNVLSADQLWDQNYELVVNIELATLQGFRTHRPFVAAWVVDADKKPVRQLALWYNKPRWLNEMRMWYSAYYSQLSSGNASVSSTTSATRPAGKYALKWDGKDDKGNWVKQATYTIYIEAAREHGTHQLMSKEVNVTKPQEQHFDLGGNVEISAASIDLRKKD